ncbi:MAG TPA: peptide ligase PGM1-related protein [Actinomycetota bacterium]|nr:peptide ligase PGM1-related protein [Actinomycetota bacterium]
MTDRSLARLDVEGQRRILSGSLGSRALSDIEEGTIIVVPSLSFPVEELRKIVGIQFYEERMLFMTLILDRPDLDMVYVTSASIDPVIVDYYLSFLPDPAGARKRLHLVSLDDTRPLPLSEKLVERPDKVTEIRTHLDGKNAYALTFNVTEIEWRLMEALGVVVYGPHPDLAWLGSKSGSRRVAQEAGVAVLPGAEDLRSVAEVERAVISLASDSVESAVIKLNNGFSGQGNAIVSLSELRSPLAETETSFCALEESWPSFERKIASEGAVVEELLRAPGTVSPSTQLRIAADGSFEVVSTHDQILGGPDNQVYLGCRFPAQDAYREAIQDAGRRMARVLAEKGVVGSFGIDFVLVPGTNPKPFVSEINLRMGGTSHPFYVARFVTRGHYDEATGDLVADGKPKYYVASDNLKSDSLLGLRPEKVIDALDIRGLAYSESSRTGATLHLLGALNEFGKLGCVAIADSREDAESLYREVARVLGAPGSI